MKITQILLVILSLLALLLFTRLWVGTGSLPEIWELEAQIEQQQAANEASLQRNKQLELDVNELGESDAAIEAHARSELGMIKKNETFYQVIMREDTKNPLMSVPELTKDKQENGE